MLGDQEVHVWRPQTDAQRKLPESEGRQAEASEILLT
jgi:hypothetical protein